MGSPPSKDFDHLRAFPWLFPAVAGQMIFSHAVQQLWSYWPAVFKNVLTPHDLQASKSRQLHFIFTSNFCWGSRGTFPNCQAAFPVSEQIVLQISAFNKQVVNIATATFALQKPNS